MNLLETGLQDQKQEHEEDEDEEEEGEEEQEELESECEQTRWAIALGSPDKMLTMLKGSLPSSDVKEEWIAFCASGIHAGFNEIFSDLRFLAKDCFAPTPVNFMYPYEPFNINTFFSNFMCGLTSKYRPFDGNRPFINTEFVNNYEEGMEEHILDLQENGHDTTFVKGGVLPSLKKYAFDLYMGGWYLEEQYAIIAIMANRLLKMTPKKWLLTPERAGRPTFAGWCAHDWILAIMAFESLGEIVMEPGVEEDEEDE
ncbi:hypothetical protein KVT40_004883 [Elsinoe batatas]|uniref:Uncharacterized protein n=1 Tax=Elsinoe batatas TaxID=2601811 RepID=A0A8K0L4N7_9PEZI|nr:hypothetical protein KVT40_004883 [Elsinoe batatas]